MPPARAWHAMAYDSVRGEVVLFGGADEDHKRLDDTWVWDGGNWSKLEVKDRPAARSGHGLIYQSQERRQLLFGGEQRKKRLSDLWVLQRRVWTRLEPSKPRPRKRTSMGWVATPRGAFLFGGGDGKRDLSDTWLFAQGKWTRLHPSESPRARRYHAMAYDEARQVVVVYGGLRSKGRLDDLWEYSLGELK